MKHLIVQEASKRKDPLLSEDHLTKVSFPYKLMKQGSMENSSLQIQALVAH